MTSRIVRSRRDRERPGTAPALAAAIVCAAIGSVAMMTPPTASASEPGTTVDGRFSAIGSREPGSVLELDVVGRGDTPDSVDAVALNLVVTGAADAGFATVYPCGSSRPDASSINFGAGETIANGLIAPAGSGGKVCIYTSQRADLIADVSGSFAPEGGFRSQNPVRLLDTRAGSATVDGRSSGQGLTPAGGTVEVVVGGRGGVAPDSTAVALNLTVTEATGPGYATVYPCGSARPTASTINFETGQTIGNSVVAPLGTKSSVCVYTSQNAHLVVDVSGSFGSGYEAVNPVRLLDTRLDGQTIDGAGAAGGARNGGDTVEVDVTGRGGMPGTAAAVALNLTVTQPDGPGFATVYPCGSPRPESSTINFDAGVTIANSIIAPVGPNGTVCIYTSQRAHLIGDVSGVVGSSVGYRAQWPARLLDTRVPYDPAGAAAQRSLALLNQLRARYGVGPLVLDAAMSSAALEWSQEMSRTGFRHSGLGFAENVAWNSSSSLSPEQAAEQFHEMWVNSSGHLRNMIDPTLTRVGIGLYDASNGWFGTHLFAS